VQRRAAAVPGCDRRPAQGLEQDRIARVAAHVGSSGKGAIVHGRARRAAATALCGRIAQLQRRTPAMPITILDPISALVVIDLQAGIVSLPMAHPTAPVVQRAAALAAAFRRQALPVVLVNVAGGAPGRAEQSRSTADRPPGWTELVPELGRQPQDHTVTKKTWGAFTDTDLDAVLRARRVTQVVIAGIATSIGVESTARQAHERGYNVTLAIDAMTDFNADAHANSLTRIFPRLGETGTSADIIALLDQRGA